MTEKIQTNRSAAGVYWEKKGEGYQRKKQGVCENENKRLALDRNGGHTL